MKSKLALVLILAALLSGCVTADPLTAAAHPWAVDYLPQASIRQDAPRQQAALAANPDWPARTRNAVAAGSCHVGMSKAQALASFGIPLRRNAHGGRYGSGEQWVYPRGNYLYFDTYGLLESWQFSK